VGRDEVLCGGVGIVFGADAGLSFAGVVAGFVLGADAGLFFAGVVAGFAVGFLAAGAAFEGPESLDEGAVGVSLGVSSARSAGGCPSLSLARSPACAGSALRFASLEFDSALRAPLRMTGESWG